MQVSSTAYGRNEGKWIQSSREKLGLKSNWKIWFTDFTPGERQAWQWKGKESVKLFYRSSSKEKRAARQQNCSAQSYPNGLLIVVEGDFLINIDVKILQFFSRKHFNTRQNNLLTYFVTLLIRWTETGLISILRALWHLQCLVRTCRHFSF